MDPLSAYQMVQEIKTLYRSEMKQRQGVEEMLIRERQENNHLRSQIEYIYNKLQEAEKRKIEKEQRIVELEHDTKELEDELLEALKELENLEPDDEHVPSYFICPIFQEIMRDPHIAADGFTYEAEAIKGWLSSGHDTSPLTNLKLANNELVPNRALRSAILEWFPNLSQ